MVVKYINPIYNCPQILKVSDAFIANNIDDEGNVQQDFIMMISGEDSKETVICVEGLSFVELTELMNELYDNSKIDLTTNTKVLITICPREIIEEDIFDIEDIDDFDIGDIGME